MHNMYHVGTPLRSSPSPTSPPSLRPFGDFGVSFVATVAGRYTRRGGPRLSVQGEPLIVLTRRTCAFFSFSFCVEEKTKVSDREFDSRWRHSACETVIAVHMVK